METHSSILAWKIWWTENTGMLETMGSQRVRHGWSDWAHTQLICYPEARIFKHLRWEDQGELHCQLKSMGHPTLTLFLYPGGLSTMRTGSALAQWCRNTQYHDLIWVSEWRKVSDGQPIFLNHFTLSLCFGCATWDASSPSRDWTWAPCRGMESWPLDRQGSP